MTDKYEIIQDDYITINGRSLYRIRALRHVPGHADKGDVGGYVGGPNSLSQEGNCWIYPTAMVHGNAEVRGDAVVAGHARAAGGAIVKDSAILAGSALAVGKVILANSERLDRDSLLMNVAVLRCGQYVRAGFTTFTFHYRAESVEQVVGISTAGCSDATALDLSLYREGGRLAAYQSSDGEVRLFNVPVDTGILEYAEVLKSLR